MAAEIVKTLKELRKRKPIERPIDPVQAYMLAHKNCTLEEAKKACGVETKKTKRSKPVVNKDEVLAGIAEAAAEAEAEYKKKKETEKPAVVEPEGKLVKESKIITGVKMVEVAREPVRLEQIQFNGKDIDGYRGVFNEKRKKIVSIVSDEYNLLPNRDVLEPVFDYLEKEKVKYLVDKFSYVDERRMRLHLTFPDLKLKDDSKEGILSSIFLHNSYNMSESLRMMGGAMRQVCSNGMVIGVILKKVRVIHQAEQIAPMAKANIEALLNGFYENQKKIQARINELMDEKASVALFKELIQKYDVRVVAAVLKECELMEREAKNSEVVETVDSLTQKQIKFNMWRVYNALTWFVSHQILVRYRVDYLKTASKLFSL